MEKFITLVLTSESRDNIRIVMPMDDLNKATILQYEGDYYTYQFFKYQQEEIWFQRVNPPLLLGDLMRLRGMKEEQS